MGELIYGSNANALVEKECLGCGGLQKVVIQSKHTRQIPASAFGGCASLKSMTLTDQVESIEREASSGCGFSQLKFLNKVKTISDWAFNNNYNLRLAVLPSSIESIGYGAFGEYNGMRTIVCEGSVPPVCTGWPWPWWEDWELVRQGRVKLFVPNGATQAYSEAEGWKDFFSINEGGIPTGISTTDNGQCLRPTGPTHPWGRNSVCAR